MYNCTCASYVSLPVFKATATPISALFHLPADLAATLFDQFKAFPPTPLANTRFPSIPEFDKPCFIQDFSILLTKFFNFRKIQQNISTRVRRQWPRQKWWGRNSETSEKFGRKIAEPEAHRNGHYGLSHPESCGPILCEGVLEVWIWHDKGQCRTPPSP